jgi:NADH-quinone oxidoreductase subunit A
MIQKLQILNLLIYITIAFIISFVLITVSLILNKKTKKFNSKLISYETGCLPTSDNQIQLNINFYIIAIIFLILDIEIILMFP